MAIVCTGMFYLTISLHIHGRPVGFIFRCRFAATPKSESDRRRSVLFLGVALRRHPKMKATAAGRFCFYVSLCGDTEAMVPVVRQYGPNSWISEHGH